MELASRVLVTGKSSMHAWWYTKGSIINGSRDLRVA